MRKAEQETQKAEEKDGEPTLWTLREAPHILREVMHDVMAAVKACSAAGACLHTLQGASSERREQEMKVQAELQRRTEVRAKLQRCMSKILALRVFSEQLADTRMATQMAESKWRTLSCSLCA
jgi:hypothetical protein